MKTHLIIALTSLVCIMTSCSSGPAQQGKKIVSRIIEDSSRGYLQVTEFKKTDGVSGNPMGVDVYEMKYAITVKAIKSAGWLDVRNGQLQDYSVWLEPCKILPDDWSDRGRQVCRQVSTKVDDTYTGTGEVRLSKHDEGWVLEENHFYNVVIISKSK